MKEQSQPESSLLWQKKAKGQISAGRKNGLGADKMLNVHVICIRG